jgi:hypothetical protein
MSWGAQNRSKDAKTPSAGRAKSEKPELDLWKYIYIYIYMTNPATGALKNKNRRHCHKAAPGKISFEACKGHEFMRELITKCYGMGLEGRGVAMKV